MKVIQDYFDKVFLASARKSLSGNYPVKYRKKKVTKYFKIKIPVIKKHYYSDEEGDYSEFEGYLLTTKEINLFPIGKKVIEVPVMRKPTGKTISWTRYGEKT